MSTAGRRAGSDGRAADAPRSREGERVAERRRQGLEGQLLHRRRRERPGVHGQAPVRFEFSDVLGFDRRSLVSGAETGSVVGRDARRARPVRHPRERRARREAGPGVRRGLLRGGERQRRPERGQLARRPQLQSCVGAAGRLLVRDLRLGLSTPCWPRRSTAPSHVRPPPRKALVSLDLSCSSCGQLWALMMFF